MMHMWTNKTVGFLVCVLMMGFHKRRGAWRFFVCMSVAHMGKGSYLY